VVHKTCVYLCVVGNGRRKAAETKHVYS